MGTTQPIKDINNLEQLKNYYLNEKRNLRNYALICTGLNTALRISDLLSLTWDQVYHIPSKTFLSHITLTEQKTQKHTMVALNHASIQALSLYLESISPISRNQYIFKVRTRNKPICREQAFRIIRQAWDSLNLPGTISCHSLRKTFGYHAWANGTNPALLVAIYNHSSYAITKRYLGIEQEDKDQVFLRLEL